MRMIITVRLQDNSVIDLVGDFQSKEHALNMAAELSPRMFRDSKFHVYPNSEIVKLERWNKEKTLSVQNGCRQFFASIYFNGLIEGIQLTSGGTKSVYNTIKSKYGIQEEFFAMVYDNSQIIKRKSAGKESKETLQDPSRVQRVFQEAATKLQQCDGAGEYLADLPVLCSMVMDYCRGNYKEVPLKSIIGVVAAIIYFVSPVDFIPDVVPVLGQLDDIGVITFALKAIHDDLEKYKRYIGIEDSDDVVVV